jgi:hypothetical protein
MKTTTTKLACGLILTAAASIAMPGVTAQNAAVDGVAHLHHRAVVDGR